VPNIESRCNQLKLGHPPKGLLLGYEGNLGAGAVQEKPTKPAKIQQIGKVELVRFGCCRFEFRHRRDIATPLAARGALRTPGAWRSGPPVRLISTLRDRFER
jgi:hypothetical protein